MKTLTRPFLSKWLSIVCIFSFFLSSCKKGNNNDLKTISVSTLEELYIAVNDPANVDSRIIIAPGTYILNAKFPNSGRIELQTNMVLQGQPGHPDQVIIDESALPGSSFNPPNNFPAGRTGGLRMGMGLNEIEWLTVIGNSTAQALSVIDADLIWSGSPTQVVVAHCILTGGRIAIDLRNPGAASNSRVLEAEIDNNEITANRVQYGQGIEVQNANGVTGATITAILHGNNVHGNKLGMRAFNNNTNNVANDGNSISIQSNADRFDENGIGIYLSAALNQGSTTTANNNNLQFEANGTSVRNNQDSLPPDVTDPTPGGIYAVGGFSVAGGAAETSNDKLEINLSGCPISGNNGPGIKAYGALSNSTLLSGINNVVEINLGGVSKQATVVAIPSMPAEPAGTNMVKVIK